MLKNSEEVLMSLIYSSLNGDIFIGGQGNIEDKKYMELTNDLGEKNKFEILKAILLSSPENINNFDSPIEQFFINIKLKIKDGLIPEDAKYINEFSNEYGVDGMLIGVQDDIYIIFIYEKSSDLLYQMVSKGRMFSQVQCLVRGIKHVDLRPEPR